MAHPIGVFVGFWSLFYALPHEATHWAAARLGTDDARLVVEVPWSDRIKVWPKRLREGGTVVRISHGRAAANWPPLESAALRAFAYLAPTIFGSLLAVVWLVSGTSVDGWRLILLVGLAAYTVPSPADVRGALGRQAVQQEM